MTNKDKIRKAVRDLQGDLSNVLYAEPEGAALDRFVKISNHTKRYWPKAEVGDYMIGGVVEDSDLISELEHICTTDEFQREAALWKKETFTEDGKLKMFTKDMLVSGKHIVKFRNQESSNTKGYHLFFEYRFLAANGYLPLSNYNDNLLDVGDDSFDVCEVYSVNELEYLDLDILDKTLIWKRDERTQEEIEIERLQKVIKDAEEEIAKLKSKNC